MSRKSKYLLSYIILGSLIVMLIFYSLLGVEQYNILYPHIDTQFSQDFDEKGFEKIEVGMSQKDVESLIGKPLSFRKNIFEYSDINISSKVVFFADYSRDGKFKIADFAWEFFSVNYNKDKTVVSKTATWYND